VVNVAIREVCSDVYLRSSADSEAQVWCRQDWFSLVL
jgi:hypothetical protein